MILLILIKEQRNSCSQVLLMAAITNSTGAGEWQTLPELLCSAEFRTGGIHSQLILLSVLNIFLSITAFLGNTLILVALYKEASLHPPSKFLLRSLATTDLCVGIIVEPFHVIYLMSVVNKQWNTCRFSVFTVFITGQILCLVSLLVDNDYHKCGQTSRSVVRAQIQTSCNFKKNLCNCDCFLDCLYRWLHSIPLE